MQKYNKVLIISNYADKLHIMREELIHDLALNCKSLYIAGAELKDECKINYPLENIESVYLPISRFNINPFKEIKILYKMKKVFKELNPDIILVYGIKIIPSCIIAAHMAGIKNLYSYVNGAGNLFMLESFKIKVLRLIAFPTLKLAFHYTRKVIFQNQDDIKQFIDLHLVNELKVELINGSGVNMDKYLPTVLSSKKITFSFLGRLVAEKGIYEFIEAARMIKNDYEDVLFIIAGSRDINNAHLTNEIEKASNKNLIEYIGEVDNSNELLDRTNVFVLPSYREGLPRVNLEAMAKKRAIITTNTVGCRDTVIDGYNGFLVNVKDANDLAEKMKCFIKDRNLAEKMGENGYRICEEKYNVKKVNNRLIDIISEE